MNNREPLTQNSAENSAKRRGNPDKIREHQFKPGQSGNPGGRPKKKPLTEAFEQLAESNPELLIEIARAVFRKAKKGDIRAGEMIRETLEGKLPTSIGGDGNGTPVLIKFVRDPETPAIQVATKPQI